MKILFFDTETTGLYDFKAPPAAEHQPYLLQLAAALCDGETEEEFASLNLLSTINIEIPFDASRIHGITNDITEAFGIAPEQILIPFLNLFIRADLIVGHNIEYDLSVLSTAISRAAETTGLHHLDMKNGLSGKRKVCTMKLSTDICKIQGPRGNKWPKLTEAYQFFFNEGFEAAHSAMGDVRACKRIFFKLKELGYVTI